MLVNVAPLASAREIDSAEVVEKLDRIRDVAFHLEGALLSTHS